MRIRRPFPAALLAAALLAACARDGADGPGKPSAEAAARALVPADPALADIYNRSCRSCHTIAATRAPLTGDAAAWNTRLEKGMDVLVDNVVAGFGGMPPFGLCMDCDAQQFEDLILFMAGREGQAP